MHIAKYEIQATSTFQVAVAEWWRMYQSEDVCCFYFDLLKKTKEKQLQDQFQTSDSGNVIQTGVDQTITGFVFKLVI